MSDFGKITVAGCGRMGLGMAKALKAAGFDGRGFDIRPASEFAEFADHMIDAETMRQETEILITVVRDGVGAPENPMGRAVIEKPRVLKSVR